MLTIKKTGEGYYLASLANPKAALDRNGAYLLKKELSPVIRPHREITLDIKGIRSINEGGYKILQELTNMANTRRCRLKFINIDPALSSKLSILSKKTSKVHQEPDTELV